MQYFYDYPRVMQYAPRKTLTDLFTKTRSKMPPSGIFLDFHPLKSSEIVGNTESLVTAFYFVVWYIVCLAPFPFVLGLFRGWAGGVPALAPSLIGLYCQESVLVLAPCSSPALRGKVHHSLTRGSCALIPCAV